MVEKMNKLQKRRRKKSDESFAISRANMKFMKIFDRFHGLFDFITLTVKFFCVLLYLKKLTIKKC